MKIYLKTFMLTLIAAFMLTTTASAQINAVPLDADVIFPPSGPFDPIFGAFTGVGESGGAPGPILGCDIYGFRSQTDVANGISLGMERDNASGAIFPVLSFASPNPFLIEHQFSTGSATGPILGCGQALAGFFNSATSPTNPIITDIVFGVFGSISATGVVLSSDKKLKKNINSISDPIELIRGINGVTYNFRSDEFEEMNLPESMQYGVIAQDLQKVMPEAVQMAKDPRGEDSHLAVNYTMLIPVLTEAIKVQDEMLLEQNVLIQEQQITIENLEQRLIRLEKLILKGNTAPTSSKLGQNRPNPVSGMTTIDYDVPSDATASLIVYDTRGVELQRINVAAGKGSVNYDVSNLSGGVYFYALEVNGKNIARQKMVVK